MIAQHHATSRQFAGRGQEIDYNIRRGEIKGKKLGQKRATLVTLEPQTKEKPAEQSLSFTSDSKIMISKPLHQSTPTKANRSPRPKAISEATPLIILNVNCQSVKSKVPQFLNLVKSTEPDIILGTD